MDRSWPYEATWVNCNLPRVLVNSSHLLDVTSEAPQAVVGPFASDDGMDEDRPATLVDTAVVEVHKVIQQRQDDPRAQFFLPLGDGSSLTLGSALPGSVLPEIAGEHTVVAVGQYIMGTPLEWQLNAAMATRPDGRLSFVGPCGSELDRQFAALAEGFGSQPDQAFMSRMISEALQPGRIVDLDYISRPARSRSVDFARVPPSVVGMVRVIGLYVTPLGTGQVVVGMNSPFGQSALSSAQAAAGGGWLLPAIVPIDGPADFVEYSDDPSVLGGAGRTLLALSANDLRGVDAVHITLDTMSMTATWEPLDTQALAALSGYSTDSLVSLRAGYESQLGTASTAIPTVDFMEQSPVPS